MKNWVDLIFIALGVLSFYIGYRAGLLSTLFSFVGYLGGAFAGLYLGLHYFHSHGINKFLLLFFAVTIGSSLGEQLFKQIGKLFHTKILFGPFRWIDSLLGGAFSLLRTLIVLVILGHLLLITPWGWASANVPKSAIYIKLNQLAPSIITDITKRAQLTH
jgi:uncharacterized membrane protein required for colicin V production